MLPAGIERHRSDVEEYYRMAEVGILSEEDRVELIDGEIVEMTPIGGHHISCVNRLTVLLVEFSARRYEVSVQNPLRLLTNQPGVQVSRGGSERVAVGGCLADG